MKRALPQYVSCYRDRRGKLRVRGRRNGVAHYFKAELGTPEFAVEYQRWLAGDHTRQESAERRSPPYSVSALIAQYYATAEWADLGENTKRTYRGILERFRDKYGQKPWPALTQKKVREILAEKSATPAAANNLRRMLRILARVAIELEWRDDDPTSASRRMRMKSGGHHTWTEDEIAAFERRWPMGSKQRLAFALMLFTAQRLSGVIKMGPQHIRRGAIHVTQQKTRKFLVLPIQPGLQAVLEANPTDHLNFLVTAFGKQFTPAGFGGWFRKACDQAGLPQCSAHGLRKAASRRLAERGCSANQIMAITGHQSLKEVTRYTAAADQKELAEQAMQKVRNEN